MTETSEPMLEIGQNNANDGRTKQVHVTIDGDSRLIPRGDYVVTNLKTRLGVPPEKELDQIIGGSIHPLDDNSHVEIKGEERFISHVRSGGSS